MQTSGSQYLLANMSRKVSGVHDRYRRQAYSTPSTMYGMLLSMDLFVCIRSSNLVYHTKITSLNLVAHLPSRNQPSSVLRKGLTIHIDLTNKLEIYQFSFGSHNHESIKWKNSSCSQGENITSNLRTGNPCKRNEEKREKFEPRWQC